MTDESDTGGREHDAVLDAYAAVVRLLGLVRIAADELPRRSRFRPWLAAVHDDLIDAGGDLALSLAPALPPERRLAPERPEWLAAATAEAERTLPPPGLRRLRGASEACTCLLLACAVARDAEDAAHAAAALPVSPVALAYLERLPDFLYVLAHAVDVDTGGRTRARLPAVLQAVRAPLPAPLPAAG